MNDQPDNSYLFWYWPAWIILLSSMFFLRMTILRDTPSNIRVFWMIMYVLLVNGGIFVTIAYESTRILAYLQQHHPEAYAKAITPNLLNRHPDRVPSGAIFFSSHHDDPVMDRLQANYKHLFAFWMLNILTFHAAAERSSGKLLT